MAAARFRRIPQLILACIVLAMTAACAAAPAGQAAKGPAPGMESPRQARPDRVPGEYILTVEPGTSSKQLSDLLAPFKPDRVNDLGRDLWLVHLRTDPGLESLKRHVLESRQIRAVQPNFRYYKMQPPSRLDRPAPY